MNLEDLESLREGWDFEAKRATGRDGKGAVPADFWRSFSAMANTLGGYIVLGVEERADGSLRVTGLPEVEKVERDLWNALANPQKVSCNHLGAEDIHVASTEGGYILVVHVPQAPRTRRPVYLNGDLLGETWLRIRDGDHRADRERVRRMVAEAEFGTRDERVLERFTVADLDGETIRAYRQIFHTLRPEHPWLSLSQDDFLRQLGAIRRDRDSGHDGLTRAGLLFFGQYSAIREVYPSYFLDYQERNQVSSDVTWSHRIFPDGTWPGNLLSYFLMVGPRLTSVLPVPFQIGPNLQRVDDTPAHRAVREALVNAIIHADYEAPLSLLVVRHPGGFTLRNPGLPRLPLEEIRRGGRSDCRNRGLQQMMLMIGYGELAGSGFARILRAWNESKWRIPHLDLDTVSDATTLDLSLSSLLDPAAEAELDRRFQEGYRQLAGDERLALVTTLQEGAVSHERLMEICGLHSRDLTLLLQRLKSRGYLEPHGEGRRRTYTLVGEPGEWASSHARSSVGRTPSSTRSSAESPPRSTRSSAESPPRSTQGSTESLPDSAGSPPSSAETRLQDIADTRWAPSTQVWAGIQQFCTGRWRTLQEIVEILHRSPKTVRQEYLRPMVRAGVLERRYPQVNHPSQAYRTKATPSPDGASS